MSGYTADPALRDDVRHGSVTFLQKPFGMRELATELRRALGTDHSRGPSDTTSSAS